jgi:hypothetical protein
MILSVAGIMSFTGCSSVGTTVNPEFDVSNYQRVCFEYGDSSYFLDSGIEKLFIDKMGFVYLNNKNKFKDHDLYVIVAVDVGFLFPPQLLAPGFMNEHPKKVTVEIQDAMTKKQLLLCTYRRWFGNILSSYPYCMEDVVEELTSELTDLKAKSKPASLPVPDDKAK